MATVVRTHIRVPTQDVQYVVTADLSINQVQNMYAAQIPGLANMVGSAEEADSPTGRERTITFAPRTGQKG